MKKLLLLQCFFWATLSVAFGQNYIPFSIRYQGTVKGDMIVVGNTVLSPQANPNNDYTGTHGDNSRIEMKYINVVPESGVFNSSSATVLDPNPASTCKKVVRAYLYWAAAYTQERIDNQTSPRLERSKFKNVKFKVGSAAYRDLVGELVYDGNDIVSTRGGNYNGQRAYVYRAEVTNYLNGTIANTYTVGNIQAPKGNEKTGVGYAAGWTLVIVYEDLTREARNITVFDGFSVVNENNNPTIDISGFKTVPTGPVKAKIGFAALEGELGIKGDQLTMKKRDGSYEALTAPGRPANNFFNSTLTNENGINPHRRPASTNLLGFDAGIFELANSGKTFLDNNDTSTSFRPYSNQDAYYPFMFAFNVEVIAPHIVMEKRVLSSAGTDITGQNVQMGDALRYKIRFQNIGNDDAKDVEITDILPVNLQDFDATTANISVPSGVTYTYVAASRKLTFNIPESLVKKGSAVQELSFGIKVVNDCNKWRDACSNVVENRASASYKGVSNSSTPLKAGSFNTQFTACNGGVEGPSNFIVNLDFTNCKFKATTVLCERTVTLEAGANFDSYKWEKVGGGTIGGNSRTLVVSEPGVYKVTKSKAGCATMYEEHTVNPNAYANAVHPIKDLLSKGKLNGEVYICADTGGTEYPQVYLCGGSTTVPVSLRITGATAYQWQKLVSCTNLPQTLSKECPPSNDNYNCNWTDIGNTGDITLRDEGVYRLVVTYGNCVSPYYYFRITKNNVDPQLVGRDLICNKNGSITVNGVPAGYEYGLKKTGSTSWVKTYQSSNVFDIATPDNYTVYVRQVLTTTITTQPCIFEKSIQINKRTPAMTASVTPMACSTNKGGIRVQLSGNPYPPFTYTIRNNNATGGVAYTTVTNTTDLNITNHFTAGNYYIEVTSPDGCKFTTSVRIDKVPDLKATASVLRHLSCGTAIVRVTATGGKTNRPNGYGYSNDGGASYQNNFANSYYDFTFTTAGVKNFKVIDDNGCIAEASATVNTLPTPAITASYTVQNCGDKAKITISEPTNASSYNVLQYSIDGVNFQSGREFPNLQTGRSYTPVLRYGNGGTLCTVSATTINIPTFVGGNLIASAGVERLVGCGTGANADKALVRFSNVQGGKEPYEFNFGDGNWTTDKKKWMLPGTYNMAVRDAIGCTRENIKVTVDPRIPEPTFTPSQITYDCQGRGSVTITNNKNNYKYKYYIDGQPATDNNFKNLAPGVHTITIEYADANPPTKNVLFFEDFGTGRNGGNEYINKKYYLELQDGSMPKNGYGQPWPSGINPEARSLADGEYVVSKRLNPNNGAWWQPNDHTKLANGRMFFVNIGNVLGTEGAILYQRPIRDLIPGKEVNFSVALMNLLGDKDPRYPGGAPDLAIELYANQAAVDAGTPLVSVRIDPRIKGSSGPDDWTVFRRALNPGTHTELIAVIRSFSLVTNGNDLAMDDIYLYQEPEACSFTYTTTVTIANDKAFGSDPASQKITQPNCNNGTGSYQIGLKNAPTTYYVQKDGTGSFVATTGNPFKWDNIPAGTHTVKIRAEQNNTNCEVSHTFTINNPTALTLAYTGDTVLGCNPAVATAKVTASGGTGTYKYTLYKGATVITTQVAPQFSITSVGAYRIEVEDANGCKKDVSFTITAASVITLTGTTNPANNNYCTTGGTPAKVEVQVNVAGGGNNAPYTFQLDGATKATQNTNTYIFNNLSVGTHTFTVIDKYGCKATYSVEIKNPIIITTPAASMVTKGISCHPGAAANAKVEIKVKDGYAPYTFVVKKAGNIVQNTTSMAGNTATYETATPGTYTIEISDAKGCKVSANVTIAAKTNPTLNAVASAISCYGTNNGTISVTVTGGKPPYTIFLDGVNKGTGAQKVFNNLPAKANYIVKVVDANNCEATQTVAVTQPAEALKGFAGVSELIGCETTGANKDKAQVRITNVTGGTPPYQYKFDGNYQGTPIGYLPAGTHTVYVKDAKGCELALQVTVPPRIPAPTGTTYTITSYDCHGNATVVFTGTPTTYDYEYIINGRTLTGATATFTGLAPGTYTVTIKYKDANPPASSILLKEDFGFGGDTCISNVSPNLQCWPNATTAGGPGKYVVGNRNSGFLIFGNTSPSGPIWTIPNPRSGVTNDRFFIVDVGNVKAQDVLYYKDVNDIDTTKKVKFEMYLYNLFMPGRGATAPNVEIRIVSKATNATLASQQSGPLADHTNPNNWIRFAGELNVTESSIRIEIRTNAWANWGCDFLVDDIYVYQEPKACPMEITKQVIVPQGKEFRASVVSQTNVACQGGNTGKATFKLENLNGGTYHVRLNGSTHGSGAGWTTDTNATTFEITGLTARTHLVEFFHNGNCKATQTVTITEPDKLTLTATITQPAMCSNNSKARVTLTANGGVAPYTYEYLIGGTVKAGPQSSNVFNSVETGAATFRVTDKNGCVTNLGSNLNIPTPQTVSFTLSATDCYEGGNTGEVTVKINGGNGGYKVKLNNGTPVILATGVTAHTFTGLTQGSYNVTVTDQYGCSATKNIIIRPTLNTSVKVTNESCMPGKIEVTATGGDGNYTYAFAQGSVTTVTAGTFGTTNTYNVPTITGSVQTYTVFVKSDRCVKRHEVGVRKAPAITFDTETITPTCQGSGNGKIVVKHITGDANFTIRYGNAGTPVIATFTGIATNTYTIDNLVAGAYSITVTDRYGCSASKNVTLQDMPALTASISLASTATCTTGSNKALPLTITIPPNVWNAYTAGGNKIYFSYDNGANWHPMTTNPFDLAPITGVTEPGKIFNLRLANRPALGGANICSTNATAHVVPSPLGGVSVTTDIGDFHLGCTAAGKTYFTATVTIANGTGKAPFKFRVNEGAWETPTPPNSRTHVFTNLIVGRTYKFEVEDANGCIAAFTGDIYGSVATPAMTITVLPKPACNGGQGQVTFRIHREPQYTMGSPAGTSLTWVLYKRTPGAGLGTPIVNGTAVMPAPGNDATNITPAGPYNLAPNETYYVVVTEGSCKWGSRDAHIKELGTLTATVSASTQITCDKNGILEVLNPSGGGGTYTYKVTPVTPGVTFGAPIQTGNSRVQIIRDNITAPALPVNPATSYSFTVNLTMEDQYGCSANLGNYTFTVPPAPKINKASLMGCVNGSISLTIEPQAKAPAASGTSATGAELNGYEYSIDGGLDYQTSPTFGNLVAGSYDLQIRDKATGCISTLTYTVTANLQATAELTKALGCGTGANAEITIRVDNGSGNYSYKIDGPSGYTNNGNIPQVSGKYEITVNNITNKGSYTVTVTDNKAVAGCNTFTKTIEVLEAEKPVIETSVKSVTCHGGNDGEIYVTEKNGTIGAFNYNTPPAGIVGPAGSSPIWTAATRTYSNLKAGVYTITVTANNCASVYTVTVPEPTAVTISTTQIVTRQFACTANGVAQQATISVPNGAITGGTRPYTIQFAYGTTTSTGNNFTVGNIAGGNVTITAIDANGCSTQTVVTINPFEGLDPSQATVTVQTPGTCTAGEQVLVSIVAAPGAPPINQAKLRYYHGDTQPTVAPSAGAPWQTSGVFTVTPNQTHTFWIGHVDTGCVVKVLYVSPDPNNFRIVNPQVKNVTCKGNNDGTATFTLSNTVSAHNYTVNLVASGGVTPPTVPTVSGANPTFNIAGLRPAIYTMTVKDTNTGCVQTYTFNISEADVALTASISVQSITCLSAPNYNDGEIAVTNATGGWGGYQYYVSTTPPTPASAVWSDTNVFRGLTAGTYHVAIRDRGGCMVTLSSTVVLANPNNITGTLSITAQNCTPNSGEITVQNVTGGEGRNYTFQLIRNGVLQGAAQTSTVFTGLGAGTYQVAISDTWGCTATLTQSVTLYDPIDSASIGVVITKQITCIPATGATLSVTHQGGSNSLRYTLTNNAGGTPQVNNTGVFTNVPAGVYKVSIADLITGCATVTGADVEITDAATVTFTYTTTAVSCHGDSNGRFVITIPGTQTQTDYQIKIVGTGLTRTETVNVTPKDIAFEGMPAGTYTVTLTSSRNCTATEVITIGEPDKLIVSNTTVTTHFKCDANNNAQQAIIQATGRGGTGTYTFNFEVFDGTSTTTSGWVNHTGVYSVTSNGTHTQTVIVYIRDANGCQADNRANPLVIPPLKRITSIDVNRTSQISCNATESITLTINGGNNKGYRIEVTSTGAGVAIPSTQTLTAGVNTANIGFNTPGYYEMKVIDLETGCYATASHTVIDFSDIEVTAAQTKPVSCVGGNDGEITLTVKGYQGIYNYQVLDATTLAPTGITGTVQANAATERREVIAGLSAGTYVIRVVETQSPYCTVTTTSVMVSAPTRALTVSPTITNRITCEPNDNKGAFSIDVTGGWGDYQYRLLVGGAPHATYGTYTTTTLFEGLTANTYTVEVTDRGGCSTTTNVVMAPPAPISASISATTVLNCFNDRTGVITVVSPTGGSGNYAYELWNVGGAQIGGAQTSTTFTNLYAGSYNVKIIDGWGCDVTIPVTIDEPREMKVTASIAKPLTCLQQATISITVTGGTPGYTYYMVANGTTTTTLTGNSTQAGVGEYEFYVIDSHGCQSKLSNKITIEALQPLQLHVDTSEAYVKCNGDSTAKITFSATGALGNYQYKLYKGGVAQTATATQENATDWAFGGLTSGTYRVEVISVDCVATSTDITIGEAPALTLTATHIDISCNGESDGTISVTVTGGTGRILYAISPRLDRFVDSGYFTKLARGNYIVRAQDENGCYTDTTFEIKEPTLLEASIDKITDEVCKGGNDGTVSITIKGGTASYSTSIDNVTWTVGKTLYTGLASGTYTIYVKDARSCTTEVSVTIKEGVDLQATATVEYSCGNNTVVNTIVASSNPKYAGYVSYSIDGGAPQASGRFIVTPGTHTVTIAHNNGCTRTITVDVEAYTNLTVSSTKTDMSCYGVNDGTITYATTGGTGSYTFTISPEAGTFDGTNKFTNLPKGQYIVKVKDNVIGCEVERTFTIVEPEQLIAHASTVTETCYGTNDGALSFRFTGGRAPYNYTLKDPSGNVIGTSSSVATGTVVSRTGIAPGRYQLEYGDSGICSQTLEITVAAAPSINATFEKGFNCSTVSTTWTTGYLMLTFNNLDGALTRSNTSYAINSTDARDARPFESFDGNRAKTAPIEPGTNQYITVFYRGAGVASTCQETIAQRFDIERYPGLELKDKSDPRELNLIKVEARGGNPPYTYYFNGSYENGSNEYTLKPTDPTSRIVNGRVYKVVTATVQDANGCEADLRIEKEFMKSVPPNFFTPNDDGSNDGWDPDRFRSYPNLTVDIYDRYGRYITTLRSGQKWDGRYDGKELPAGDYWYILKTHEDGEDAREYMGHFTLYR
ncbi:conserved repeat protein [Capnocytophaga ochracea F0287]|uniref:Conserved repeat protein n=1 Tax=Capnocytophaga ochracea F0287 TaxID=873517 RepID=E4MRT4_CAPOC|nr:T9SS type B sorting domain-containing protein [Capnocytophaga ochracea]EFS97622.1 conserved repeat protein [Capnocytophaga ochracea F0287]EJF44955.1 gliding motility-associated C-terminal domain protein [Capnocytophaga ochracea str. Holt 25]UEB44075.1 T9SS C-terminal target domain-containing protein [Capnocytophaga ochracea]